MGRLPLLRRLRLVCCLVEGDWRAVLPVLVFLVFYFTLHRFSALVAFYFLSLQRLVTVLNGLAEAVGSDLPPLWSDTFRFGC